MLRTIIIVGLAALGLCAEANAFQVVRYQGQLKEEGKPANGFYDMEASLFDAGNGGSIVAGPIVFDNGTNNEAAAEVVNGLFQLDLDFGPVFDGSPVWLELRIRPLGVGNYEALSPRHAITAAPHSLSTRGVKVDDIGQVGVGTSNPQNMLHVGEGDDAMIQLGLNPQLMLQRDTTNDKFRIQLTGGGYLGNVLQLGRDDQSHNLSLMGNVGIGTSNPAFPLHIQNDQPYVQYDDMGGGSSWLVGVQGPSVGFNIQEVGVGTHFVINEGGKVGIGTVSPDPSTRLHVIGPIMSDGASGGSVGARNPNNPGAGVFLSWLNDVARIRIAGDGPGAGGGLDIQKTGDRSLMRITHGGFVGLGTTSPAARLHIAGTPGVDGIMFPDGTLQTSAAGGGGGFWNLGTGGIHYSNGSVGIGIASPHELLHVHGRDAGLKISTIGTSGGPEIRLQNPLVGTGAYGSIKFQDADGNVFSSISYGKPQIGSTGLSLTTHNGGVMKMLNGGNTGFGLTEPEVPLHVDGGGDASPGGGGYFAVGRSNTTNIVMDDNEIMARNNGSPSTLFLNNDGGDVRVGGSIDVGYSIVSAPHSVSCPAGTQVIGGGCNISGDAELKQNYPSGNGWTCAFGDDTGFISITAYAICARIK